MDTSIDIQIYIYIYIHNRQIINIFINRKLLTGTCGYPLVRSTVNSLLCRISQGTGLYYLLKMNSSETAGSSIFTNQAMTTNPPTLSDSNNVNPDTVDTVENSVEITDQTAIADGDGKNENPEIDTDVKNASDSQQFEKIEVSEVFYHNENNNMTYDSTSEFSDIEDDNPN